MTGPSPFLRNSHNSSLPDACSRVVTGGAEMLCGDIRSPCFLHRQFRMRMEIFVERFQVWQQNAKTCEDACRWLLGLLAHVFLPPVNSPVAVLRRTNEPSNDLAALWTIN